MVLENAMSDSETRQVNETAEKITLKTRLVRGEGTRDQDKHDLKVRAETPEQAADDLSTLISELEDRSVFERAREIGNESDTDE